jgi:asparagine synthase (glutamine-hydrolysing)
MCGIGGCVVRPGETPSRERLQAMREALAHRGPDGSGLEIFGNVGLVHTRLAIVDVSERAHQPMQHPSGEWWISFNGEIYNHQSLRGELIGERFASAGDTDTLLHAVARWGPKALPRLNGQFAFAALDLVGRRLLLARDRFGIKPLFIASSEDGIWFASEISALLAAGVEPIPGKVPWQSIFDWTYYREEETLIDGVRRLIPGSCLEITLDTAVVTSHQWDAAERHVSPRRQEGLQSRSRSSLTSELEGTLRAAVHDALLGDVEIGTLCSGGVDSSLITAMAKEVKPNLVAFGASYKGDRVLDEGPAAQRVAEALNVELDLLDITKPTWRSGFVPATLFFGAPLGTASSVAIALMAERARRRGIKVLLTGEGADELFGGYSNPHEAPLADFLPKPYRAVRYLEPMLFRPPSHFLPALSKRAKRLLAVDRSPGRVWSSTPDPDGDNTTTAASNSAYAHHDGPRGDFETKLLLDLDFTLSHLLGRMDENMMQTSVEARVPFLDPRVVELALNLPLEARVGPWSKGILRDVARRVLPLSIAHRRKIYGMDFDAGAWIEEVADPQFLVQGVFRDCFAISNRDFTDLLETTRGSQRVRLWSAEVWCRAVFAAQSPETIEKELWPDGP